MKIAHLVCVLLLAIPFLTSAQKQIEVVLYESGRPLGFEFNNAKRTVGKEWGVIFQTSNGISSDSLSKSSLHSNTILSDKYGSNWNELFFKEVAIELKAQNSMRELIKEKSYFKDLKIPQAKIELQPICKCKKKYLAKVVGQQLQGDKKPFVIYLKVKVNLSKKKLKLQSDTVEALDFEYRSNGIVKDIQ